MSHGRKILHRSLSKQICNIQGQVVNVSLIVKEVQQSLERILKENNNDNMNYSDNNDDEISLPLIEYTDFEALNEQLNSEVNFRKKIVGSKHTLSFFR